MKQHGISSFSTIFIVFIVLKAWNILILFLCNIVFTMFLSFKLVPLSNYRIWLPYFEFLNDEYKFTTAVFHEHCGQQRSARQKECFHSAEDRIKCLSHSALPLLPQYSSDRSPLPPLWNWRARPAHPPCGITRLWAISMETRRRQNRCCWPKTSSTHSSPAPKSSSCSEIQWRGDNFPLLALSSIKR